MRESTVAGPSPVHGRVNMALTRHIRPRVLAACGAMALMLSFAIVPLTSAEDKSGAGTSTDQTLFPRAYGVLANEKLMYPVDMSDWPIKIDSSHQLFVDDYLLASVSNIKRTVHQATKFSGNPIMADHAEVEGSGPLFAIVRRDEKTGTFRMWYTGRIRFTLPSGTSVRFPALYAESKDGLTWKRPRLGLHEFQGSKANNIVIPAGNFWGIHVDPHDPNPKRRYKGIVWHEPEFVPREGYFLYTSPDGIHWTRESRHPIALSLSGYTIPQTGIGDTSLFRWDRHLGKYVGDVKFVLPGKMRVRGFMESDDLVHWSRPRMTVAPDAVDDTDTQIYSQNSFCYESMWLGYLRVMHTERTKGYKQTTVELTASRDGRHWYRVGNREEIIPLGSEAEWDTDYHDPLWEPVPVGDELWVYYRSGKIRRDLTRRSDLGLAKFRRDGFVSLDAGEPTGILLTRPMSISGKRLFLNAEVQKGGHITVSVLDRDRKLVTGDSTAIIAGGVSVPVRWKNSAELRVPGDGHVRLRFDLKHARLYSFWIE